MAPKSEKTSYVLSSDAFNLTRWSGDSEAARTAFIDIPADGSSFSKCLGQISEFFSFFSFSSFPLIFRFNQFLDL